MLPGQRAGEGSRRGAELGVSAGEAGERLADDKAIARIGSGASTATSAPEGSFAARANLATLPLVSHILLVDDDEDLRDAIQAFLTDQGHEVTTACNGLDALDLLAEGGLPEVALVDVFMPVMDGIAMIEKMRADPRLAEIPVIVMSASTSAKAPPGTTFIPKTSLRDKLTQEIDRVCAATAEPGAS